MNSIMENVKKETKYNENFEIVINLTKTIII